MFRTQHFEPNPSGHFINNYLEYERAQKRTNVNIFQTFLFPESNSPKRFMLDFTMASFSPSRGNLRHFCCNLVITFFTPNSFPIILGCHVWFKGSFCSTLVITFFTPNSFSIMLCCLVRFKGLLCSTFVITFFTPK